MAEVLPDAEADWGVGRTQVADLSGMLALTVQSCQDDPAHLRSIIYDAARMKVRLLKIPLMETLHLMLELEVAISRIERQYSQSDLNLISPPAIEENGGPFKLQSYETDGGDTQTTDLGIQDKPPAFLLHENRGLTQVMPMRAEPKSLSYVLVPQIKTFLVAFFAVALYVLLSSKFGFHTFQTNGSGSTAALPNRSLVTSSMQDRAESVRTNMASKVGREQSNDSSQTIGFPLPTVYGVYAVSNGQLHELHALPGVVPDQKVYMSTAITKPSLTTLSDGQVVFVIYRRDLALSAPERTTVRVIARVRGAMSFDSAGKAKTERYDDTWTVRNVAYDFRVAPFKENPEILLLRPENDAFNFPAGRYGLVLKRQAFDFSVAGEISDRAQCLERVEAANGSFYTECRKADSSATEG